MSLIIIIIFLIKRIVFLIKRSDSRFTKRQINIR